MSLAAFKMAKCISPTLNHTLTLDSFLGGGVALIFGNNLSRQTPWKPCIYPSTTIYEAPRYCDDGLCHLSMFLGYSNFDFTTDYSID